MTEDGLVENRVIEVPLGMPASTLVAAGNYLDGAAGRPHHRGGAQPTSSDEIGAHAAAARRADLARRRGRPRQLGRRREREARLIVRGQAQLLEDVTALADLERLRTLFEMLETKETVLRLLELPRQAEGVQIFIGAENHLFGVAGCSMIIAPYQNSREQIVGAIGVIGPTRINYARIIPMVDYTARVVSRLLGTARPRRDDERR